MRDNEEMNKRNARCVRKGVLEPTFFLLSSCDGEEFATVVTTGGADFNKGILSQYFKVTTSILRGKLKLYTNENLNLNYNDKFIIRTRKQGLTTTHFSTDLANQTWGVGTLGFDASSNILNFELDLSEHLNTWIAIDFIAEDDEDNHIDSGMAVYDLELQ